MPKDGTPLTAPSEEAGRIGLALAKAEGAAYGLALEHMTRLVAAFGEVRSAGEYQIALALEKAEGLYVYRGGYLEWQEPGDATLHIEVAVRDAADGRFIPGLTVHAQIQHESGSEVASLVLPFLWHPTLYHYGQNVRAPAGARITVKVRIDPPPFLRHDKVNGRRYADPAETRFGPIELDFLGSN